MCIDRRRAATSALAATVLAVAACADAPTAVPTEPLSPSFAVGEAGFVTIPLLLRAPDGSESTAWGNATVFAGVLVPPSPCGETHAVATIAVCGMIHNPAGELLTGGTLTVRSGDGAPVVLEFAFPPNPCLRYAVRAVAGPDLGTERITLPAVQLVFETEAGAVVSATPGPPNEPALDVGGTPGPPDAPPNPCLISFGGRTG
jgi:hypothetical protein